jgi:3-phenylpropionate/cinnamic acid dioxygenase small subunit
MTDARLQALVDRAELSDLVYRYAQAIDRRDWALLRSCFAEAMEADFRSFGVREVFRGPAEDWVALVRSTIEGCDSTQHQSSNHRFELDRDRAQGSSYIRAEHVVINDRGDNHYTVAGYYSHEFLRTPEGWRTAKYTLHVTSSFGNRHVLALATRRAARMAEERA